MVWETEWPCVQLSAHGIYCNWIFNTYFQKVLLYLKCKMEGMPGGCNPADVLNKLASNRGIRPPTFELVSQCDAGLMCPWPMSPRLKVLGCCAPCTKRPLHIVPLTDVSQPLDRVTYGPHNAWVSRPRSWVKLGALRAPSLTITSLIAGLNAWTASRMPGLRPLHC